MHCRALLVSFGGVTFTWLSVILVLVSALELWSLLPNVAGSLWQTVGPVSAVGFLVIPGPWTGVAAVRVCFLVKQLFEF